MLIGEQLKERRLEKGLTVEDIQSVTKIQARHIQAIERNDFSLIPGNFYVRAFIREYAQAVGLDSHHLMDEHKTELPETLSTDTRDFTTLKRSRTRAKVKNKSPFQMLLPTIFVLLLLFLIGFIIYKFVLTSDETAPTTPVEDNPSSVGEEVSIPSGSDDAEITDETTSTDDNTTDELPTEEDSSEVPETSEPVLELKDYQTNASVYHYVTEADEITLTVDTTNQNWLQIEDSSGQSLYEQMLTTSNGPVEIDLTGADFTYLRFGEPGIISIDINGIPVEFSSEMNMSSVQEVWIYFNDAYEPDQA
ncbi:XRE family transcriptional regulator [Halolactibacillus halophilus]|nr:XRE family transcriptional regulator [Halolactibacillus halophilus]